MSRIEISKKRLLTNTASSAISIVINISVLLWLQQFLLKRISPEEYSLIPVLLSIMAIAPLFTIIFTGGIGRYITVAYAKNDNDGIKQICSTMFPILLVVGLLFLFCGWFAAWNIERLIIIDSQLIDDAKIMFAMLIFSAAIRLPLSVFGSGFIVTQKLYQEDFIKIGCQLLRVAILFGLLYGVSVRVLWVVVALVISELVVMAISIPISLRLVPEQRVVWGKWRKSLAKEITNYGSWGFVNQIAETIKQAFDPLILNQFSSAVAVSTFYVAGLVPRQLKLVLFPITRPFIPILAAMCATEDFIKLRNTYLRVARYHAWLLLSIAVPAIVFSDEIISLYLGGLYQDSANIMVILIIITVLDSFNALGSGTVAADGRMKALAIRKLTVYGVNVILATFFIVYLEQGAIGAAIATLISIILIDVTITWPFCRRVAHCSTRDWLMEVVYPCIGAALPSILLCLIARNLFNINTWFELILTSFFSWLLFVIVVAFFGLRLQDKLDLERLAKKSPVRIKKMILYLV